MAYDGAALKARFSADSTKYFRVVQGLVAQVARASKLRNAEKTQFELTDSELSQTVPQATSSAVEVVVQSNYF